jgi:hypothetical protein
LNKVHYQYTDPNRGLINKEVTYYLVEATGGTIQVQIEEINKVYWMNLDEAWDSQREKGYDNNQEIFDKAYELLKTLT